MDDSIESAATELSNVGSPAADGDGVLEETRGEEHMDLTSSPPVIQIPVEPSPDPSVPKEPAFGSVLKVETPDDKGVETPMESTVPGGTATVVSDLPSLEPSLTLPTPSYTPGPRSQSPAKRAASEMESDYDEGREQNNPSPMQATQESALFAGPIGTQSEGAESIIAENKPEFQQLATAVLSAAEFSEQNALAEPTNANASTAPSEGPATAAGSRPPSPPPSLEIQCQLIEMALKEKLQLGQSYYVLNIKWLRKLLGQCPEITKIELSKQEQSSDEVGPIDNSDLIDKDAVDEFRQHGGERLTAPSAAPTDARDTGDLTDEFIPLKQGDLGADFEILPKDTWDMLVKCHGVAKGSPVFRRRAVNTSPPGTLEKDCNLIVELYPPTFTIYKLQDQAAEQIQKDLSSNREPPKIVAGKTEKIQSFLNKVKSLASVSPGREVRLWRLAVSSSKFLHGKSTTLNKGKKNGKEKSGTAQGMTVDIDTFIALEDGAERELIVVKDPHKHTIDSVGLGTNTSIVLEEKGLDGEFPTDKMKKKPGMLNKVFSNLKGVSTSSSRNSSPVRNLNQHGMISRAKDRKQSRPIGACGLHNLGNTCYMNSALQCLRNVEELSKYFLSGYFKKELNPSNPLSHGGNVAKAYANLLEHIFSPTCPSSFAPREFKHTIGRYGPSFSGYGQQDTQEFLAFLLDGLHEDLNRIHEKPYIEKPESTDEMIGDDKAIAELAVRCWDIYRKRNDSAVADLFGGLYKSTLVCPVCAKVSITFDPFMDLTLPLPIENVWSGEVFFYPLGGKRVIKLPVEMDKNGNIKGLKEYIAKKLSKDPAKIIGAEVYKNKFFKIYEESRSVSETIQQNDTAFFYELEDVATNWPPPPPRRRVVRSLLNIHDSFDENEATATLSERLVVPVFSQKLVPRAKYGGHQHHSIEVFGHPFFIIVTKEEAMDINAIYRKVAEQYQAQTTTALLSSIYKSSDDGSDVVVNAEDASVDDGKRVKENESEDGYVDVSMEDATTGAEDSISDSAETYKRRELNYKGLDQIKTLFSVQIFGKTHSDTIVPTGWTNFGKLTPITDRIRKIDEEKRNQKYAICAIGASDGSDDDYDTSFTDATQTPAHNSDDDVNNTQSDKVCTSFTDSLDDPVDTTSFYGNRKKQNKNQKSKHFQTPLLPETAEVEQDQPLVRLGEALVCEWKEEQFNWIFGGKELGDMRGLPLWDQYDSFIDAELVKKRQIREHRRKKGIHLEDCLDEFVKEEILSETDPWYCPRCKEHRRATKKFELWKCPDILVIHLKRMSSSRSFRDKIDVLIDFPIEELGLTQRVGDRGQGKELLYDLFAVDNHYGGLGGGHYTAYAKNYEDKKWYYFDDSSVHPVANTQNVVTPAAYLLFYRRRSNKPLGGQIFEKLMGDLEPSVENDSGISESAQSSPERCGGASSDFSRSPSPHQSRATLGATNGKIIQRQNVTNGYAPFGGARTQAGGLFGDNTFGSITASSSNAALPSYGESSNYDVVNAEDDHSLPMFGPPQLRRSTSPSSDTETQAASGLSPASIGVGFGFTSSLGNSHLRPGHESICPPTPGSDSMDVEADDDLDGDIGNDDDETEGLLSSDLSRTGREGFRVIRRVPLAPDEDDEGLEMSIITPGMDDDEQGFEDVEVTMEDAEADDEGDVHDLRLSPSPPESRADELQGVVSEVEPEDSMIGITTTTTVKIEEAEVLSGGGNVREGLAGRGQSFAEEKETEKAISTTASIIGAKDETKMEMDA